MFKKTLSILLFMTLTLIPSAISANEFLKPLEKNLKITQDVITYDELHDEAIFNCPWSKKIDKEKEKIVATLIQIEKRYNLPEQLRGMLLAAACHESGYEVNAKGDFRKNRAMAIGLFQMWPWWEKAYKINRRDVAPAADAYMKHVQKMYIKVSRQCKLNNKTKRWLAAWATAIRAPKKGGRCFERPLFYRVLKKWHSNIKKSSSYERNKKSGC